MEIRDTLTSDPVDGKAALSSVEDVDAVVECSSGTDVSLPSSVGENWDVFGSGECTSTIVLPHLSDGVFNCEALDERIDQFQCVRKVAR